MTEVLQRIAEVKSEYLYEMLQEIKKRPGIFLGRSSITRLRSFLDGYMGAREDLGLPRTDQEREFNNFQDWIQKRYNITSSHSWNEIILFYSADERDALDNFFKLFEKFQNGESPLPNKVNINHAEKA
ncbi:hypothetical protein [Argonema galeatum]|uniref:hypothetical protein n=1 Tax=Argonema galeatum TaxID=2942762 RepID=UPI0020112F92|nr:hypothetical protein [Argonema galeatum]MCL1462874.1 hypothetical protein [Argonema galeatum A003/A1]